LSIERVGERVEQCLVVALHHGEQKIFFAAEVGVDRPTGESGDLGDLLQGRPLEASPGKDLCGRLDQGGSGQFAASLWGETLDRHAPIMPRKFILDI